MPNNKVLKVSADLFDPIEHESVANSVVQQVESFILSGVLKEGTKLPAEREMADQFAVSRPKVRQALQVLEERNLIRIVAGDGAYIAQLGAAAMSPALIDLYRRHPTAIYDQLEYRREQECFAARLASTRGTASDRELITEIMEKMTMAHEQGDHELGAELDAALHSTIVNASHNRTLIHMMASLYELNRSAVFFNRRELMNIDEVSELLLKQHLEIGEAVCSGNAEEAVAAAAAHIDYVRVSTREALAERERELMAGKRKTGL
jgi:GntR family transcriptional regulator, transcriptional repressor for pyruvate dehydrogenase complex